MARQIQPLHSLAAIAASVALVVSASQPIRDPDAWWHAWIGTEALDQRTVTGLGNSWAPFGDQDWTTTQWLPEVIYSLLVAGVGWSGVTALRLLANAITIGLLAWVVLRDRPARVAVPVYVLGLTGLVPFLIQDRPQTLVLVLVPVLASMVTTWLHQDRSPRPWHLFFLTFVWANLHGSWVLVPSVVALMTLGRLADRAPVAESLRRGVQLGAVSVAGGLLTPASWLSLVAIVRFSGRTELHTEWQPTMPANVIALPLALLVALLLWAWARSASVPRSEIIVCLGLVVFGMLANRNIPYATILLAPLVATRLSALYPRRSEVGQSEGTVLAVLGAVVVALGLGATIAIHQSTDAIGLAAPARIAAVLAEQDEPVRVLNTHRAAGVLLEFSDGNVELGIDGRADRYPIEYTSAYLSAIDNLTDWQALVDQVDPQVAVLQVDEALATHLQTQGWQVRMRDEDFLLLAPRGSQ